jgi:hypothetical protein
MPVGLKCVQHTGGLVRLADCSSASLPHLATRDMGHPQFPGPKWSKQIFLVRMFFILLGGPKAHDCPGRDDNSVAGSDTVPLHLFRPLQHCHPDRSEA